MSGAGDRRGLVDGHRTSVATVNGRTTRHVKLAYRARSSDKREDLLAQDSSHRKWRFLLWFDAYLALAVRTHLNCSGRKCRPPISLGCQFLSDPGLVGEFQIYPASRLANSRVTLRDQRSASRSRASMSDLSDHGSFSFGLRRFSDNACCMRRRRSDFHRRPEFLLI